MLAGGRSSEHAISRESARSVLDALDPERYDATAIEIAKDGRWQLTGAGLHLPPTTGSATETLPVVDGLLALGRWQRLFLIELDHPRTRQIHLQILGQ